MTASGVFASRRRQPLAGSASSGIHVTSARPLKFARKISASVRSCASSVSRIERRAGSGPPVISAALYVALTTTVRTGGRFHRDWARYASAWKSGVSRPGR